jgi:hypothetical protein
LGPLGTDPVTLDEADFGKEKNGVQGWRWLLQVAYGKRVRRLWIVQEQLLKQDLAMLHGRCQQTLAVCCIIAPQTIHRLFLARPSSKSIPSGPAN